MISSRLQYHRKFDGFQQIKGLIYGNFSFVFFRKEPKTFAFDHCFNSINVKGDYAGQEKVFQCLGRDILDNAFQGYNACIFAYGQTGN